MRTTLIWSATVIVVVAAILIVVRDGGSADDEAEIRALLRAYATATVAGDGQRACALMTPGSRARFALGPEKDCATFMRSFAADLDDAGRDAYRTVALRRIVIDDSAAEVEAGEELGTLSLAERGDRWLLDFEGLGSAEIVNERPPPTIGDRIAAPPTG